MARTNDDDMLMDDDLAAAFLSDDPAATDAPASAPAEEIPEDDVPEEGWDEPEDFPGQLAVDVYETTDKLVVKARTAGISKNELDVTISDNILTISGVLSGGEDEQTTRWHIQECYWGEFSRTIALPVQVREDDGSVKAELKDGVLTITFEKVEIATPTRIQID
ncbi:MAG: Hsp20/alpha crystallin family protein [Candidatus Saccharibacteria bacterium]|nr:Hsp20/alpha crystallin family protein [Candidatus Saccharibacteria bacterium]